MENRDVGCLLFWRTSPIFHPPEAAIWYSISSQSMETADWARARSRPFVRMFILFPKQKTKNTELAWQEEERKRRAEICDHVASLLQCTAEVKSSWQCS